MTRLRAARVFLAVAMLARAVSAQQVADSTFNPWVERSRYQIGQGPLVAIDAAHLNFHTADGGYAPFVKLLRLDGYGVESSAAPFAAGMLARMNVPRLALNVLHWLTP